LKLPTVDFSRLHRLIVEITLLILLLIGAYKVIRAEWPAKSPPDDRFEPHKEKPPQPERVRLRSAATHTTFRSRTSMRSRSASMFFHVP
jgi:hypothetical protein